MTKNLKILPRFLKRKPRNLILSLILSVVRMKRKAVSVMLSMVMAAALAVPVLADEAADRTMDPE